ncbi:hypothetical protein BD626DRAFT_476524 [Schizophyllum amplum]|uniref:Phospholipase/carboxylesterase/thioesterase domain-containing protein n=1 Tax=Schizophyllum amplum TaxID=97359 RepID=A0A550CZF8_9AGAR|nr:hypothetical protein BD626DRAFT_476524 [Auriculariopsis ampla]
MSNIHITEASASPKVKPQPSSAKTSVPFTYFPSDDGTDENLLIILHGLGDTHVPFAHMGKQLKLPQTAVLALRAPQQIPFMDAESYQWYPSFDPLGELINDPDPTTGLDVLARLVEHLTGDCAWAPHQLHFFGFAQGGSLAAEFGLRWWREHPGAAGRLGSIVTVSAPLLSYPTLSQPSPTPVLVLHTPAAKGSPFTKEAVVAYKKGYGVMKEQITGRAGMPASREEWEPIMRFWSEHLGRRQGDGLYEVMTGASR